MTLTLLAIVILFGMSALAAISGAGASDSCGGCDTQPLWSKIGIAVSPVLLVAWIAYVFSLLWRGVRRHTRG